MDWVGRLNQAISYIESKLHDEIDMNEVSRITGCPLSTFQRFFMLSTGITLTEYIRRRRLTSAAVDLQTTDDKVITVALRYGYDTSDAFCVAFKRMYGMTPSMIRRRQTKLRHFYRLYFTLSATHIKEDDEMVLQNVDRYRVTEPLFEGVRIILSHLGEAYTPEYIQGISGAAFRIAGGCPSRPTCVYTRWPADFIRYLGYEAIEHPCFDAAGNDISEAMVDAVKRQIDGGRPALVWHAFTNAEWDVVCGYDEERKQFIGRGSYRGLEEYDREPWTRSRDCDIVPSFGAVTVGNKRFTPDGGKMEWEALHEAVKHARKETASDIPYEMEGIQFYRQWVESFRLPTKERDAADAYCHEIYSSCRRAGVGFLRQIAPKYAGECREMLEHAAALFESEVEALAKAKPYLSWESPWGVNAERNKAVAPMLAEAADAYERGIASIERAIGR